MPEDKQVIAETQSQEVVQTAAMAAEAVEKSRIAQLISAQALVTDLATKVADLEAAIATTDPTPPMK